MNDFENEICNGLLQAVSKEVNMIYEKHTSELLKQIKTKFELEYNDLAKLWNEINPEFQIHLKKERLHFQLDDEETNSDCEQNKNKRKFEFDEVDEERINDEEEEMICRRLFQEELEEGKKEEMVCKQLFENKSRHIEFELDNDTEYIEKKHSPSFVIELEENYI